MAPRLRTERGCGNVPCMLALESMSYPVWGPRHVLTCGVKFTSSCPGIARVTAGSRQVPTSPRSSPTSGTIESPCDNQTESREIPLVITPVETPVLNVIAAQLIGPQTVIKTRTGEINSLRPSRRTEHETFPPINGNLVRSKSDLVPGVPCVGLNKSTPTRNTTSPSRDRDEFYFLSACFCAQSDPGHDPTCANRPLCVRYFGCTSIAGGREAGTAENGRLFNRTKTLFMQEMVINPAACRAVRLAVRYDQVVRRSRPLPASHGHTPTQTCQQEGTNRTTTLYKFHSVYRQDTAHLSAVGTDSCSRLGRYDVLKKVHHILVTQVRCVLPSVKHADALVSPNSLPQYITSLAGRTTDQLKGKHTNHGLDGENLQECQEFVGGKQREAEGKLLGGFEAAPSVTCGGSEIGSVPHSPG
ncbi:hypothetical protein Bbelb_443670 [Branchiostoma belcheri]|nr:hypothetical protein Bbelb_443670 [Branchiostoma belcheri]